MKTLFQTPLARWLFGLLVLTLVLVVAVLGLSHQDEEPIPLAAPPFRASPQQVERGAYLAKAGNCAGCHTARGGAAFAGGLGIDTPFGMVYSSNLTPDLATGLGGWSSAHFWRAMHNGRSKDGHALTPVFPYPNYTLVTRDDADALYAYLHSLPAITQVPPAQGLRFPFNSQAALAVWRALFFAPGRFQADATRSAEWNLGAYWVRGLGHCNACHANRNALGATSQRLEFGGGLIPMQGWYAPSLTSSAEAGVAGWSVEQVVALLKHGVTDHASALGPMAEVVYRSTQHLSDADLRAMAVFLKALPQTDASASTQPTPPSQVDGFINPNVDRGRGIRLYEKHCADCHGAQGQGGQLAQTVGLSLAHSLVYPALAGNRAVTMANATNVVRIVRSGGFAPATAGNPRPFGMPPFDLNPDDLAAVVSYIRGAWGNHAAPVSPAEVLGATD
jgi:mono/diheme cytochrome c family protein